MPGLPPEIKVSPVHPLPILQADAAQLGLGSLLNHYVPTAMGGDAGTVVLALGVDTRRGRSPLYRLEECFAPPDTELLLGKAVPPQAVPDATAGRGLDRLSALGTLRLCTAWAVRAATRLGVEHRSGPFETTSRRVWGADQCAETQTLPLPVPDGSSQAKRPDLKQCGLSTLCVARAVPIGGKPEAGTASDKPRNTTLLSASAQLLADSGGQPGASISSADAALVPEDKLAALRATWFLTR